MLAGTFVCAALPIGAQTPGERPPTPIEQALVEHWCRVPGQASAPTAAQESCLHTQLLSLRSDFGPDLQKLTTAERRTIDKSCSEIRTLGGRDEYIGCLAGQLTAVRDARGLSPASTPASVPTTSTVPVDMVPIAAGSPVTAGATSSPRSSTSVLLLSIAFVAVAGGGAWVWMSKRPLRLQLHVCRVCGADVGDGDLCAACRHEAAESQRRSIAERSETQRRLADEARRAQEHLESLQQQQDRRARDTQEAAKEAELERQRDVAKRRDDETRRWQEQAAAAIAGVGADAADDATADPYTLLGVTSTASEDEIRAAYATCRAKYAADQVAHLSQDLQDRYRHKAAAVERAFQALTRAS
jgi:hypothetical protein